MKYLDLSFAEPSQNLACDEILLDLCEEGVYDHEIIRFWESPSYFVVLGRSNKVGTETNRRACEAQGISILRRTSGGGTVLQGPGCLNYSLILNLNTHHGLDTIDGTTKWVLQTHQKVFNRILEAQCEVQGISDLAIDSLKFSGNAQRRKRNYVLFHGTFLYQFNIPLISVFLKMPSLQPDYRDNREHESFLTNVKVERNNLKEELYQVWEAHGRLEDVPLEKIEALAKERYESNQWNLKH